LKELPTIRFPKSSIFEGGAEETKQGPEGGAA